MPPAKKTPAKTSVTLPGGYKVGEKVFFTGTSQTFPNGDKVVHGQQGEVTGPTTLETHKGKGVRVLFPGNKQSIGCYLTEVRRLRAASAANRPLRYTRDAAHAPCVPVTASAAAPQPSLHEQPRSRRSPLPGCGREGGRGVVRPGRFGGSARECGGRALVSLLLTAGGCVHR